MAHGIPGFLEAEFENLWSSVTHSNMQLWVKLEWLRKQVNIWSNLEKYEVVGKITPGQKGKNFGGKLRQYKVVAWIRLAQKAVHYLTFKRKLIKFPVPQNTEIFNAQNDCQFLQDSDLWL